MVGTLAVILYGIGGIYTGIAQQQLGLPPGEIDCAYRVELLRDRVAALTQRSPQQSLRDPQDDVVSTLIRETQAACATKDAQSARELETIASKLREHLRLRAREAEARRDLLAL